MGDLLQFLIESFVFLILEPLVHCLHGFFSLFYSSNNATIRRLKRRVAGALRVFGSSLVAIVPAGIWLGWVAVLICLGTAFFACHCVGWLASKLDKEVAAHRNFSEQT